MASIFGTAGNDLIATTLEGGVGALILPDFGGDLVFANRLVAKVA